mmetsp:Transcript_49816/g.108304  ORF Transcript_49816/g.108304 Transcript_49816/m.108304 type:complete len:86 (-) Transcript_49816:191-448(-)
MSALQKKVQTISEITTKLVRSKPNTCKGIVRMSCMMKRKLIRSQKSRVRDRGCRIQLVSKIDAVLVLLVLLFFDVTAIALQKLLL